MSDAVQIDIETREQALFEQQVEDRRRATSRMFAWLMGLQWVGAIVAALVISPYTWIGEQHRVHQHVWLAVFLGGVLASLPIGLTLASPSWWLTRHTIAAAQMLFSALLIHLTGGRIETHFHVFGSLAFLAFYRDWPVLVTATVVVASDHLLRGVFAPLSVFGTTVESDWRWVEHAGWVLFEDTFLVVLSVRGLSETRAIAARQSHLEHGKEMTEREVQERTRQLREAAAEREALHNKLVDASREAGMAEVATGVLHNVGNVLNSVNVGTSMVLQRLRGSEAPTLARAGEMIREHRDDLAKFLSSDERGRHLPDFLLELGRCLAEEQRANVEELDRVTRGVDHIKHVIQLQQAHARKKEVLEEVDPATLVEAALQLQSDSLSRHGIALERRIGAMPTLKVDRHRILQILVNILNNAKDAVRAAPAGTRRVTVSAEVAGTGDQRRLRFEVADTGVGIAPENLSRIFAHGFTTRDDGHGFGLHSAAVAAGTMGGSLKAHSDGLGKGASFVLTVPVMDHPEPARPATARAA